MSAALLLVILGPVGHRGGAEEDAFDAIRKPGPPSPVLDGNQSLVRAVVQARYGDPARVLRVEEVPRPEPADGEVLVRVRAASVHADVWHVVRGLPWVLRIMGSGILRPTPPVPGTDLAGVVEAVGAGVTRFVPGDAVFGESCGGMQWRNGGAYAEYAAVAEACLAHKPAGVAFEEAAAVPTSGCIALDNLQGAAAIQPGQEVLINGAAGALGSVALQIGKAQGARVTGVDGAESLDLMRRLGADEVIDYREQDVTGLDRLFDLVFDVASTLDFGACRRILSPSGTYVRIGHDHYGSLGRRLLGAIPDMLWLALRWRSDPRLPAPFFDALPRREALEYLAGLLADGQLTPVIDSTCPLEGVPAALARLAEGRARGRLIVTP